MFRTLLFIGLLCLVRQCHGQDEWVELFDGKSLDGWTQRGGKATYAIENNEIIGTTVPRTPNSFLCTDKHYDNFLLELEFKVHPELNSGIQIRSHSLEDYRNGRVHGYQIEIDPSDRAWTAGIYDESRRGWLIDLRQNDDARYAFKQNQWNALRIVAHGDRFRTWLNDVPAADLNDDMTASGFIALQVHGVGIRQDPISIRWRNIRLRTIGKGEELSFENQEISYSPPNSIFQDEPLIEKVADGFRFVEGPAMGPDGKIYFSDIPNERIHVFDPANNRADVFRENSGRANGLMWTPSDALVACEGGNRRVTRQLWGGDIQVLADKFEGKRLNSPNDLALDNVGGIYFTDPRYGNRDDMEMEIEGVYYLNRNREISRVIDDLQRPNGIVVSLDYETLYVADQAGSKIWQYKIEKPGTLGDKKPFAEIGSDGMTIDRYGNIYCTWRKHVHVFSHAGTKVRELEIPEGPANVTFGGESGKTMFVTARTGFYKIETNVVGARTVPLVKSVGVPQWTLKQDRNRK